VERRFGPATAMPKSLPTPRSPMRAFALLAAATLLLAGCSGGSDPTSTSSRPATTTSTTAAPTTQATTSSTTTSGTTSAPPAQNAAPTATLAASVPGGALPLNVTFTLDAKDADGDNLTYTFDADGQAPLEKSGSGPFPVTLLHRFEEAGNYTATFQVSDGTNSTTRTVLVQVTAGQKGSVVFTGHIIPPDPWAIALDGCLMQTIMNDAGGPGDVVGNQHMLEPIHAGWAYTLVPAETIAEFWSDEPAILGTGTSGTVPEESDYVNVCANGPGGADVDYTLTLTQP
jgi:PKD repeat protein